MALYLVSHSQYDAQKIVFHSPNKAASLGLKVKSMCPRRGPKSTGSSFDIYGHNLDTFGFPVVTVGGNNCSVDEPTSDSKFTCSLPSGARAANVVVAAGQSPHETPTQSSSELPSMSPLESLGKTRSQCPSKSPSDSPTESPNSLPSDSPSKVPSMSVSESPSAVPTASPSESPYPLHYLRRCHLRPRHHLLRLHRCCRPQCHCQL
jgi:hypothetical protein